MNEQDDIAFLDPLEKLGDALIHRFSTAMSVLFLIGGLLEFIIFILWLSIMQSRGVALWLSKTILAWTVSAILAISIAMMLVFIIAWARSPKLS